MVDPANKSWQIQAAGNGGACQQVMADPSCRLWWSRSTSHGRSKLQVIMEPVNKSWQIQAAGNGGAGQQVMADPSCR